MKRTYVDFTGDYYDNLDKIIDWGENMDLRFYDPEIHRAIRIERRSS